MVVYALIFPTDEFYIGKTTQRVSERWAEHAKGSHNDHVSQIIKGHGWNDIQKVVLEVCRDKQHLAEREAYWMDRFDAVRDPMGLNKVRATRPKKTLEPVEAEGISEAFSDEEPNEEGQRLTRKQQKN